MKLNNLIILGAIGLGAWYFLSKRNGSSTTPSGVVSLPPPVSGITGSDLTHPKNMGAGEIKPPPVNSGVDEYGRLVTAPVYIASPGYTTSYTASGNEIRTTIPSYASAGTDPLMTVKTEVGGGQHLAYSNKNSTADQRLDSKNANIQDLKNRGLW